MIALTTVFVVILVFLLPPSPLVHTQNGQVTVSDGTSASGWLCQAAAPNTGGPFFDTPPFRAVI